MAEQTLWDHRLKKKVRPVVRACGIHAHSYSLRLQKALTDFGADDPFAKVAFKMKEHYGIDVPVSSGRTATLKHAAMWGQQLLPALPRSKEAVLIGEVDGSMVPIVAYPDQHAPDRRKKKTVMWKEAKLCLVRAPDKVSPAIAVTMGDGNACGELWRCVAEPKFNNRPKTPLQIMRLARTGVFWHAFARKGGVSRSVFSFLPVPD